MPDSVVGTSPKLAIIILIFFQRGIEMVEVVTAVINNPQKNRLTVCHLNY
jgi:hypothetical protein